MIVKWILALAYAASVASASSLLTLGYQGDDLDALCNNQSVDLVKISQLKSLVEQLDKGSNCPNRVAEAMRALKSLIDEIQGDECSMASVGKFRAYFHEYLDTSDRERVKTLEKLPKSFKTFALGYGMELSSLCRANMVRVLVTEVRQALQPEDMEELIEMVRPGGLIDGLIGSSSKKPDELMLPSDFMTVMGSGAKEKTKEKISLKMQTTPLLKRIQIVCKRRLKPIYGQVMLPLAQLANLGFEHRGAELKKELKAAFKTPGACQDVGVWSRVVLVCEGLGQIELVEEKKDAEQAEGNDATMVRILTPEEAEEAKKQYDAQNLLNKVRVKDDDIQELVFKPSLGVSLPDKVLRSLDLKQRISLAWLSTSRDEATKIRLRFFTSYYEKFFENLRHFRLNDFFAYFFNRLREHYRVLRRLDKHNAAGKYQIEPQDIVTDIIKAFNARVDKELNPDLGVADDDCNCPCPDDCDCCCCCCSGDACSASCCCCGSGGRSGGTNIMWYEQNNYYGAPGYYNGRYYDGGAAMRQAEARAGLKILKYLSYLAIFAAFVTMITIICIYVLPSFMG